MRLAPDRGPPTIALTFDACSGLADERIIDVLIQEHVSSTIFVTGRWLKRNPKALARLLAYPKLFQIENHGHKHIPAIDRNTVVYGLQAAGSAQVIAAEVEAGREDVRLAAGRASTWYRGAAALYTHASLDLIRHLGQRLAGYSLAGDGGAHLSGKASYNRMMAARDGDVLLLHINQPHRSAGQGVAEAIRDLKRKGYRFVRLDSPGLEFIYEP
jgi:peptidoglycan/xylan/chitin deacetylase (PgdA/CDA1 family)